jgi:hypothetical protein
MMRKGIIFLLMMLGCVITIRGQTPFWGISADFTTDSKPPEVSLIAPDGGGTFGFFDPLPVTWTATDDSFGPTPISIGISTEPGGTYSIVASGLPNTGSAIVTPPGITTQFAKVKVIGIDGFGIEAADTSDSYFTFDESFSAISGLFTTDSEPPEVSLIAPKGGETFGYFDPLPVTWTATDDTLGPTPISIGISTEPGGAYTIVASDLPNTGSALVTPPGIVTQYAKVKVIGIDGFGIEAADTSNTWFTFDESFSAISGSFTTDSKPPQAIVISPNGGETFGYYDPLPVTWTATDDTLGPTPISIGISTEPGGDYTLVASDLPNTGSALVTPPGIVTPSARVKVIVLDAFGIEAADTSDTYFTFDESFSATSGLFTTDSKPPLVTLISPDGGEAFYYSEPLLVKWNATDDSFGAAPVTISVSTDGGASYSIVASNLPDTDSAYVSPPEAITDLARARILVQDAFGLTASDESEAVFSLLGFWIDLRTFLEGPFDGSQMLTQLNTAGYLPLSQPYDSPPWNYPGTENVTSIPSDDVVDWVLIEVRDAANASSATGATVVARKAAFITRDGNIATLDGSDDVQFGVEITQNLFAVVWHRNHLGIMSAAPLAKTGDVYVYDFTTAAGQVHGGSLGQKELVAGVWGMISGDGDADKTIGNIDKLDVWNPQAGTSGYKAGDFNMNAQVDNIDKNDCWRPNAGRSSQVPG